MTDSLRASELVDQARWGIRLSLLLGLLLLAIRWTAYLLTGSTAILSDAAESMIHVAAAAFAAFSLRLSTRPAHEQFLYGHDRISFFSAGFEAALIALAAAAIIWISVLKWMSGPHLEHLTAGVLMTLGCGLANAGLGFYLLRAGKRTQSLILESNGSHVLADSWSSFGVLIGLLLVALTGWAKFDLLAAAAVSLNILWSGWRLVYHSIGGLIDYAEPATGVALREKVNHLAAELDVEYHGLSYRDTGRRLMVEIRLKFPYDVPLGEAHQVAARFEQSLPELMGREIELVMHLESAEDHAGVFRRSTHRRLTH